MLPASPQGGVRILGVDPGINHYSIAYMCFDNRLLEFRGCLFKQYTPKSSLEDRLLQLFEDSSEYIKSVDPDIVVIEGQYFGKNVQTLRSLSEGAGVLKLSTMLSSEAKIFSYTPNEIKLALAGNGMASKEDMIQAIREVFHLEVESDLADAIGAVFAYIAFEVYYKKIGGGEKKTKNKKEKALSSTVKKELRRMMFLNIKFTKAV